MTNVKETFTTTVRFLIAGVMLSVFNAEAADPTDRSGFSGKQLFEHEWQWTGPNSRKENRDHRREQLRQLGNEDSIMVRGDGLGPLHNGTSCVECHVAGGGSDVKHNVTLITIDPRSEGLQELTGGGNDLHAIFPGVFGAGGVLLFNSVVHDQSTRDGYDAIRSGLAEHVPGGIEAAWFDPQQRSIDAIARRPVVAGRLGSVDYYLSQRNSPALFGLGVIDSINVARLRALARRQADRTDGEITGRFTGKFGWRGQVQTLQEFVIGACAGELGLNQASASISSRARVSRTRLAGAPASPVFAAPAPAIASQAADPADPNYLNFGSDMTQAEVAKLVGFVAAIPRPVERTEEPHSIGDLLSGEQLFNSIGCVTCHVADIHPVSGMFSDLLLHDMGPDLQAPSPAPIGDLVGIATIPGPRFPSQARRLGSSGAVYYSGSNPTFPAPYPMAKPEQPQFPRGDVPEELHARAVSYELTWDSLQREWRTPPLWGIADTAPYLHDGRAETLEQAILWHGGEAKSSRERYAELPRSDKDLVVAFLSSLRAPGMEPVEKE